MSLDEVHNVVLLFSNPVWGGAGSLPNTVIRNITSLSSQIAYSEHVTENLTTLTSGYAQATDGIIGGLLYVPDLTPTDACTESQWRDFIPTNVTRQRSLPPTNYNLIAIAPWINVNCTKSFLSAARTDPLRAFIFYIPNNSTEKPPEVESEIWNLHDNNKWKTENHYPVYAVPGATGAEMMHQLSLYSGDVSTVPFGDNITAMYQPNPDDYVRIWTELRTSTSSSLPGLWVFILVIIGVLLLVVGSTSVLMHFVQSRRRKSLRRRVMSGEVNLEAMGIKRVTVPLEHVQTFPLFTYNYESKDEPPPSSPTSTKPPSTAKAGTSVVLDKNDQPNDHQPTCPICLEDFEVRVTIIRELPCGHIYHPECIDEFLSENSSLCPMCKSSMLPRGYCPKITNSIVKRERAVRRLRQHVTVEPDIESGHGRIQSWGSSFKRHLRSAPTSPVQTNAPVLAPDSMRLDERRSRADMATRRMQELRVLDDRSSEQLRPRWKRALARAFPGFS